MYSKIQAAYIILNEYKKPLSAKEIIRISLERDMIKTSGKTPAATLNADFINENKRKKKQGKPIRFKRVAPQTWALVEWD